MTFSQKKSKYPCDWCGEDCTVIGLRKLQTNDPDYGKFGGNIGTANIKKKFPPHICIECRKLLWNMDFRELMIRNYKMKSNGTSL